MQMRGSLRMVATAQEMHYRDHGTYTRDLEALTQYVSGLIPEGVELRIAHASSDAWAADARHPELEGRSCVQAAGRPEAIPELVTLGGLNAAAAPGCVQCDFDRRR